MADETISKAFPLIGWNGENDRPDWLPGDWRSDNWPAALTVQAVEEWLRLTDESLIVLADWEQSIWSHEQREWVAKTARAGSDVVYDVGVLVSLLRRSGLTIAVKLPTGEKFSQTRARQLVRDVGDALAGASQSDFRCPVCGSELDSSDQDRTCETCRSRDGKIVELWIAFECHRRCGEPVPDRILNGDEWIRLERVGHELARREDRHDEFKADGQTGKLEFLIRWAMGRHGISRNNCFEMRVEALLYFIEVEKPTPDPPAREGLEGSDSQSTSTHEPTPNAQTKSGSVLLFGRGDQPIVKGRKKPTLTDARYNVVLTLLQAGDDGLTKDELDRKSGHPDARKLLRAVADIDLDWDAVISFPGTSGKRYRFR